MEKELIRLGFRKVGAMWTKVVADIVFYCDLEGNTAVRVFGQKEDQGKKDPDKLEAWIDSFL